MSIEFLSSVGVAFVLTAGFALYRIFRLDSGPIDPTATLASWRRSDWLGMFASVVWLIGWCDFGQVEAAFLLVLFGAMLVLACWLYWHSRSGRTDRGVVGANGCALLVGVSCSPVMMEGDLSRFLGPRGILIVGGLVCLGLAFPRPRPRRLCRKTAWLWSVALGLVLVPLYWFLTDIPSVNQSRRWLEACTGRGKEDWGDYAIVGRTFSDLGRPFDRPARVDRMLDGWSKGLVNPNAQWHLVDAGLIAPEEIQIAPDPERIDRWLRPGSKREPIRDLDEEAAMLYHLAVADDELRPAEREILIDRLVATWNELPRGEDRSNHPLATACLIVDLLDAFGTEDPLAGRAEPVHELLRHYHRPRTAERDPWEGGFARNSILNGIFDFSDLRTTDQAVRLMTRFGVPAEIDLDEVWEYAAARRPSGSSFHDNPHAARAVRDRLEREFGVPGMKSRWFRSPITMAALLLTLFCLLATVRARGGCGRSRTSVKIEE